MSNEPALGSAGFIDGIRVLEIGDERGEYCGKVLAGLGADVVRVEPPAGEITRTYGPFLRDDPDPNHSLYFWHFNFAKRSITLDLDDPQGAADFAELARCADVILDSKPRDYFTARNVGYHELAAANPGLIWARRSEERRVGKEGRSRWSQ